jgi:Domain of unknown function (DUF929)
MANLGERRGGCGRPHPLRFRQPTALGEEEFVSKKKSRQVRRAEERARALQPRRPSRRRPLLIAGTAVAVVLVAIGALVAVKLSQGGSTAAAPIRTGAPPAVVRSISTLPARVFDKVGYQADVVKPQAISGRPLTQAGKPLVVYLGGEYCPYCAAERWAIVSALSRFGTFHDLGATHSSSSDVYPSTATFSFHGARYTSRYLSLDAVELYSNKRVGQGYATLDHPTAFQASLDQRYGTGAIPFVDICNRYVINGASYDPGLLQGLTMRQIAAALRDPSSPICKAILGTANAVTAGLCKATGGQPGNVCSSPAVTANAASLAS